MPNDHEYGSIEQKKRNVGAVYVPEQWRELVKSTRTHKPFIVKEMEQHHFKTFSPIRSQLINRKRNTVGDKVGWMKIQWMRFTKEHPWDMQYKHSHSELEPWKTVIFKNGRGRPADLSQVQPSQLYKEARQITKAKYNDLMSLFAYIPPVHHGFYLTLKPGDSVPLEENIEMGDEEEH